MSLDETLTSLLRPLVMEAVRDALATQKPMPAHVPLQYLTPEEAGKIASVTAETIRTWVRAKALKAYWAGRLLRVRRDELEAYLSRPRSVDETDRELQDRIDRKVNKLFNKAA